MTDLSRTIRDYYFQHFDELSADKQFHFVSRLSAWSNDPKALDIIKRLKPSFATPTIDADLRSLIENPPAAKVNAAERRAPYFTKYPQLRGYMLALFRVRHLLFHYDIDVRESLLAITPRETLYELSDQLQRDSEAIAALSTYAINYIYLVEEILFPRDNGAIERFLPTVADITKSYSDSEEDSLLYIYLLTHCIIGASNFYQSSVAAPAYLAMVEKLEQRISQHFDAINLDNKFEFLVCCKIVGHQSILANDIQREALHSISPNGDYLVDTVNKAAQGNKTSLNDSEHRNVLYIMSQSTFSQAPAAAQVCSNSERTSSAFS